MAMKVLGTRHIALTYETLFTYYFLETIDKNDNLKSTYAPTGDSMSHGFSIWD